MKVKTFEFSPIGVHTYVAYDETNECVIIDAGCIAPNEQEDLRRFITDNNLTVKHLLNTHMHFDHVLGVPFASKEYGMKIKAHADDQFLLDGLQAQLKMFGFNLSVETPEVGTFLTEDDIIQFGNQRFDILHIPGHSPGSIVFYNKKANAAFVGDVIFFGSVGRTDLARGNHEQLIDGIREKLLILPPETLLYSGHGITTTIGQEIRHNPFL